MDIHLHEEGAPAAVGTDAQHRALGTGDSSRLVKRDERKKEKTLASNESSGGEIDSDYESEIYRMESRGRRGVIVAYPVPLESVNPLIAHIDWCAFTMRLPSLKTHDWVMGELARLFGFNDFNPRRTGLYGYKHSTIIEEGGLIAWGGKNQKGTVYVSLNAQGCARIFDWIILQNWCEQHGVRLTRIDLAHDDFLAMIVSIEKAREWFDAGGFNAGGRKPDTRIAGDWWGGRKGRTVYLGARENGKLTRIYEKGKQLGDPDSPWTRIEVELHNKLRVLPLDVLARPAAYLAGTYPCLRYLSAEQCKIKTITKGAQTSYTKAVEVARNQYGKLVNLMMEVHGGDSQAVVQDLARDGLPGRLDPYSYHLRTDPALVYALDAKDDDHAAVVT